MTTWLHTPIIHIHAPIVAGGDTMSSITEKARARAVQYARERATVPSDAASDLCAAFLAGYAERAAESLSVEQVADIIERHRRSSHFRLDGVATTDCACGGWSYESGTTSLSLVPRLHAAHVAAMIHAGSER